MTRCGVSGSHHDDWKHCQRKRREWNQQRSGKELSKLSHNEVSKKTKKKPLTYKVGVRRRRNQVKSLTRRGALNGTAGKQTESNWIRRKNGKRQNKIDYQHPRKLPGVDK